MRMENKLTTTNKEEKNMSREMTATETKLVTIFKSWDETAHGIFYGEGVTRPLVNDVSEDFGVRTLDTEGKVTDEFSLTVSNDGTIYWHDFRHVTQLGNVNHDVITAGIFCEGPIKTAQAGIENLNVTKLK